MRDFDFSRWDRFVVTVMVDEQSRCLLWDAANALHDVPCRGWSLQRLDSKLVLVDPEGKRRTLFDAGADIQAVSVTLDQGMLARVQVRRRKMPPAVFSPRRTASIHATLSAKRFHLFCGSGETLLADQPVGTLFRAAVDANEVLIVLRRGTQAYVYTKVDGLTLQLSNGRVMGFPSGRRFAIDPDSIERGVFRWNRYWWRVASAARG